MYSFLPGSELSLGRFLIFELFVGDNDLGGVLADDGLRLFR